MDLKNKKLYKLLWLPQEQEMIRLMRTEHVVSNAERALIFKYIKKYIDIVAWHKKYALLYDEWLNNDTDTIFNIKDNINVEIIQAIKATNNDLRNKNMLLFYWFDIDRTWNNLPKWKKDPFTCNALYSLDPSYNNLNRKISLENFLVFPIIR